MPFAEKIVTKAGVLGIWKLGEPLSLLISQFSFTPAEQAEFDKIKNEKRKKEYLATRLLLQQLLNKKCEIEYLKSGKPQLKSNNRNISISHSANFVAVILSSQKVGIDIENSSRNIGKLSGKFLHKKELNEIEKADNKQIATILYWSAKEALFKCTDDDGIQFNKQIIIHPFDIKTEENFAATLDNKKQFKLWHLIYENNIIVTCVE